MTGLACTGEGRRRSGQWDDGTGEQEADVSRTPVKVQTLELFCCPPGPYSQLCVLPFPLGPRLLLPMALHCIQSLAGPPQCQAYQAGEG